MNQRNPSKNKNPLAEYLLGDTTYRKLGSKYGVGFRVIHYRVTRFQGKPVKKVKSKIKLNDLPKEGLPTDVKQLQEELPWLLLVA